MSAKTAPGGTNISSQIRDAVNNIKACLDIMSKSKDLYHTELKEELREKVNDLKLLFGRKKQLQKSSHTLQLHSAKCGTELHI